MKKLFLLALCAVASPLFAAAQEATAVIEKYADKPIRGVIVAGAFDVQLAQADGASRQAGAKVEILKELENADSPAIYSLFDVSRSYRNSITDRARGPIEPAYEFSVDVVDEIGAISTISVILAAKGISIKNIGINHNREHGEGALRISFYDEKSRQAAWDRLLDYKYTLIP